MTSTTSDMCQTTHWSTAIDLATTSSARIDQRPTTCPAVSVDVVLFKCRDQHPSGILQSAECDISCPSNVSCCLYEYNCILREGDIGSIRAFNSSWRFLRGIPRIHEHPMSSLQWTLVWREKTIFESETSPYRPMMATDERNSSSVDIFCILARRPPFFSYCIIQMATRLGIESWISIAGRLRNTGEPFRGREWNMSDGNNNINNFHQNHSLRAHFTIHFIPN